MHKQDDTQVKMNVDWLYMNAVALQTFGMANILTEMKLITGPVPRIFLRKNMVITLSM